MALFFSTKQSTGILFEDAYGALSKLDKLREQVEKASSFKTENEDIRGAKNCLNEAINGMKAVVNPQPTETDSTESAPTSFRR